VEYFCIFCLNLFLVVPCRVVYLITTTSLINESNEVLSSILSFQKLSYHAQSRSIDLGENQQTLLAIPQSDLRQRNAVVDQDQDQLIYHILNTLCSHISSSRGELWSVWCLPAKISRFTLINPHSSQIPLEWRASSQLFRQSIMNPSTKSRWTSTYT
jgi:hypothetical protein